MNISFRSIYPVIMVSFFTVSCASLMPGKNFDPVKISSIKSVAVVSFTVPKVVNDGGGFMNDLNALIGLADTVVSGGENKGSSRQIANKASASFIEGLSASGHWNVLSVKKVLTNAEFKSLVEDADKKYVKVSMDGTPVVRLRLDGKSSEFASQAAKALGVDGVMMLAADKISYVIDEGERSIGTGVAKMRLNGVFKLYDKDGNSLWESEITARTDETISMVAGSVNTSEVSRISKSLGRALANEMLEKYKKDIGK